MFRRQVVFGAGIGGALALAGQDAGRIRKIGSATKPAGASRHLCMAEDIRYRDSPAEDVQRRFDFYRQLGFGVLRTNISWRQFEIAEGYWQEPEHVRPYYAQAIRSGFRLKLALETMGAPPGWFLRANPDALIRNAAGETSSNDLSPWHPNLQTLLSEKLDRLFDSLSRLDLFTALDFVFVDLGPASEPIYPAAWTQGKSNCHQATPWFYDQHARADFARAMTGKYHSLAALNQAWGTQLAGWSDIAVPLPGEQGAARWIDALTWYRDSKRRFIRWQVANYRRAVASHIPAGSRPNLIIMVPGRHIRPEQWQLAAQAGTPDCSLSVMTDSEFLIDLAEETGSWLQYTAVENGDEVQYLRDYMNMRGNRQKLWGENVGVVAVAREPDHLADVVLQNRLYGLDYVRSSRIFEADGTTPNLTFEALGQACRRMLLAW